MKSPDSSDSDALLPSLVLPLENRDHILGPLDARSVLVEYGDYECPHCAHVQPVVHGLLRELGDQLCFCFRHYPQPDVHPHSTRAAEAAEAAGMQGKFWLMHDRLFEHQNDLSDSVIRRLEQELPVDMRVLERDMSSGDPARRVAEDLESGQGVGVEETPTFFLNGRLHVGSYEFLPLLDAIRKSAGRRTA